MRIDGTVKVIEIVDYSGNKGDVADLGLQESNSESKSEIFLTERMQADILGALPPLSSFTEAHCANELNALVASEFPLGSVIKTKLLSTAGITHCQFATTSNLSVGSLTATRSFSLQLPQFVFWVNFCSIDMFLDLLKDIAEMDSPKSEINSVNGNHGSLLVDEKKGSNLDVATLTSTGNWRVNISMPNARLILCPPVRNGKNTRGYSSWDKFLAIDFHSPSTLEDGKVQDTSPRSNASLWERYTSRTTCSLHLSVGNLKIYLVNLFCQGDGLDSSGKSRQKVSAQKVLFVYSRAGSLSKVSMLWQECPVIGSWDIESAKSLATPEEYESRENFTVKGSEYATATSANKKNLDYRNSGTREEIILSSAFFLHVHLFPVIVDIGSSQYVDLHHFLGQMIGVLSDVSREVVCVEDTKSISQTSILVVCESLELSVRPDIKEDIRSSLQNDLPGSWHCLKLRIQKLEMLSVSNVGGIRNANLFWLSHQEGKLWGAITGFPDRELLLISCSNSTRKRGDGGGSNALSSRSAGSDIIYLWDPRNLHAFTSITISCITIVAVGGRLDWLGVISSFFSLPSAEKMDGNLPQGDMNAHYGASFVLKLLDVGLSYEPHMKSSVVGNLHTDSGPSHFNEETGEPFVACLLAASSLYLANIKLEESFVVEYKIRVQDLGLLLCPANENLCGTYNVEYLREMGYVRIAWEALIEAKLRTNCKDGLFWDLECSKSHIYVETCHDTTSGLMRLGAQLQQLFAPDLEDSLVYLQNRWDNVQQAQERNEFDDVDSQESTLSTSPVHVSSVDTGSKPQIVGLMDQICEDAFHLDENQARQFGFRESQAHERFLGEACNLSAEKTGISSNDVYFDGTVTAVESSETSFRQKSFPEVIEGYYLSDSPEIVKSSTGNCRDGDLGRGCNGWYEDAAINIVENHISEESEETDPSQFSVSNFSSVDSALSDDFGKATGRIVLKNIDVSWRMYSGSDWHACKKNGEEPTNCVGRETTACLELTLSGTQFQHVFYPVGGLCASKLSVSVQDFYLCDKSKTAPWKLILGYYHSKNHPRESSSNAFKLDLEAVRPDPQTPLEEYRLRIALLPMLLHLHQSQLDFLVNFFGEKGSSVGQSSDHHQNSDAAIQSVRRSNNLGGHAIVEEALLPYFQKFDIWPIVLQVDYSPCRVDLAALGGGKYVELVNLVPWKGVKLHLKHVHAVGVYGWGSVCEAIIGEWLEDISQHQIRKVLRGIPTIRSLVAVGNGAAKLVSLPVESYRKDHRVLKGMQKGTIAFLKSLSLEAVGLGVHLAAGAHDILLQAEYILTSIPHPVSGPQHGQKSNVRCNQPRNAQQGIQQAYESLSDGLGKSASALVRKPFNQYQRGTSAGSALATAVRAVPGAAIAPVTACASAAHHALLGIRNSLDPEHKKESMEKYLGPTQPHDWN
uniref:Autophagy-related protein 2 n=1 Tax=Rhizophora mucronata TaxID=61149 RepID=A0A2P2KFX3_RHIMU